MLIADYKVSLKDVDGPEREQVLHSCHQRSADKLLQLCFQNGGIYIKLGQHIGQLVRPYFNYLITSYYASICTASWKGSVADQRLLQVGAARCQAILSAACLVCVYSLALLFNASIAANVSQPNMP